MTIKQAILKMAYPVFNGLNKLFKRSSTILQSDTMAHESFYDLSATLNNGDVLQFSSLKNKKVLLVNTASDCGYTRQYDGLQELHERFKDQLFILGFPSNDFGEQEKGDDTTISSFCRINYGVQFPLAKKSTVIKSAEQNSVYEWLSSGAMNGWNDQAPTWNFCKYLVDENGHLTHFFEAAIEPDGPEMKKALEE